MRTCDARDFVDDFERARLVGLHGQAEATPLREFDGDARGECVQHVERELEAIALFRVDRQVDVGLRRGLDELPRARQQFREDALALRIFVAREQRAELDRDAVGALGALGRSAVRDGVDRVQVRREIALRIGLGARAFAEHVVAEAQAFQGLAGRCGLTHRFLDRAAEHELAAEQLDRADGRGNDRLRAQALQDAAFGIVLWQEPLRQRDRARGQVCEHLVRPARGCVEIGLPQLVGGERDRGFGVGNPQQRFGEAHQREPFGAGDRVLLQQRFHRPERRGVVAHRLHPRACSANGGRPVDLALQRLQQRCEHRELVAIRLRQTD